MRTPVLVLGAALAGAGLFALLHTNSPAVARDATPEHSTIDLPSSEPSTLPPGHPAIGTRNGAHDHVPPLAEESSAPALTWTAPATWKASPSASTMRLATYRIPHAAGDVDDAEMSVVRAGGSADANIERWIGQFDEAGKETRETETIRGIPVTIVAVRGTFLGGGMMGSASTPHPGWALLAAIVEPPGSPYFFKMTGPAKTVSAARAPFEALVASVTPVSPSP